MKSSTNARRRSPLRCVRAAVQVVALSSAALSLVRAQESDPNHADLRAHFPPAPAVVEVPFRYEVGKILVDVQVNGSKPLLFVLDTGAGNAVLLKPEKIEGVGIELTGAAEVAGAGGSQAARYAAGVRFDVGGLRLEDPEKVPLPARRLADVTVGRGLGGALKGDIGRVDRLRLGGSELSAVVTTFPRTTADVVTVGADGNLGSEVLRRFAVTFDYAGGRMLLAPTAAVAEPFLFSTAGVRTESWIAADGSLGADDVYTGSPAARGGLEVGDRILAVDGRPARDLGVDGVRARLSQTPGTRVMLAVRRGETTREVELELAAVL